MDKYQVAETHVSRLIFTPDHVYKIKKPVVFGFIDMSSVQARTATCQAEVALNRRLAPDVYEGVGAFVHPDGTAEPVVVMRRLPEDRSLGNLIKADDPDLDRYLADLAATLADFHKTAERNSQVDAACRPAALLRQWRVGMEELRSVSAGILDPTEIDGAEAEVERYIGGRVALFEERIRAGRAVDGHGDLLCDDIFCLPDGVRILDCLEFSAVLRYVDPLSDIASLAMDLEARGRGDLAARFLASYQTRSGDVWTASLAHFYIAYRAVVRSKVACLKALSPIPEEAQGYMLSAQRLFALGRRHLQAARVRLVLVGGLPGTGKSTLAHQICEATGWTVLSSDVLRKRLAGLEPDDDASSAFGTGLYAPEATATVYSELLEEAGILLQYGVSVVIDGSWIRQSWRDAATELAARSAAQIVSIHCEAGAELTHHRIDERLDRRGSDASVAVAEAMAAAVEPWIEAIALDTSAGIDASTALALEIIGVPRRSVYTEQPFRPGESSDR